ncbi:putative invertase/pectin methylesterase inhibitor domain superfamily [Helianthus annuus]|nr:putative invertase/pectin methylesterase inhibitor domain superfamily [Helianthus annuus]
MIMVHKHINFFMSFSLSIIIIFCSFFVSTQAAEVSLSRDINGWCQTTPHPGHCMHYLTGDKHRVLARKKDFRILALEAALGQVKRYEKLIYF